jgi:hypothetical protein
LTIDDAQPRLYPSFAFAPDDLPEDEQRRRQRKIDLVAEARRLVEKVALLDASTAAEDDLDAVLAELHAFNERADALPDFRATGLNAAPGWASFLTQRSPISGQLNPVAAPLHLESDGTITRGWAVFGAAYEGPPDTLHGGIVAAAFDELLGVSQAASGTAGMTARITIHMRRPTPLHVRIDYEGGVEKVEGRKIFAWGKSFHDGQLLCESDGLFIQPRPGSRFDHHER